MKVIVINGKYLISMFLVPSIATIPLTYIYFWQREIISTFQYIFSIVVFILVFILWCGYKIKQEFKSEEGWIYDTKGYQHKKICFNFGDCNGDKCNPGWYKYCENGMGGRKGELSNSSIKSEPKRQQRAISAVKKIERELQRNGTA